MGVARRDDDGRLWVQPSESEFGHGRFLQAGQAGVAQAGGVPDELAGRFQPGGAVGQAEGDDLVVLRDRKSVV